MPLSGLYGGGVGVHVVFVAACVCVVKAHAGAFLYASLTGHVAALLAAHEVRRAEGCKGCPASEIDLLTAEGAGIPIRP